MMRPYQAAALDAARAAFRAGRRRVLLVGPTGLGKTVIFCAIVRGHVEREGRVLVIVHRVELLDQTIDRLRREGIASVGAIIGGRERTEGAAVQVASIGTLLAVAKRGEALPDASLVVFDEAHHFVAAQWGGVAAHYADSFVVGVTATPERGDGTPLGDLFEELIPIATTRELIALGFLVPPRVIAPRKRRKSNAMTPLDAYQERAAGRSAVIFLPSVAEASATALTFVTAGIPAASVDGETPADVRKATLEAFARGELRVICNCFVLTEGWDCPSVEVCILARGFSHVGSYLQAVGRVLRPFEGKTEALILDLRGVVYKHGLPDEDRVYSLTGRAISRGEAPTKECPSCKATILLSARECPHCGEGFGGQASAPEPAEAIVRISREEIERAFWVEQIEIARMRGYQLGWAAHRFAEKFGRFPRKLWKETKVAA
jgi:DNA repair protein RadD